MYIAGYFKLRSLAGAEDDRAIGQRAVTEVDQIGVLGLNSGGDFQSDAILFVSLVTISIEISLRLRAYFRTSWLGFFQLA